MKKHLLLLFSFVAFTSATAQVLQSETFEAFILANA